jgi:DNA-binding LacI/PurR family transcriptional regulator
VAREAGVNKSTVSRALRGDSTIGVQTRERIQQLAVALNYAPNANAQRLNRDRTDVLAFAPQTFTRGGDAADPFLVELLASIMSEASVLGQDVLLCQTAPDVADLSAYRRIVQGSHADGFILTDLRVNDPRVDYLCEQAFPHVLFGRSTADLAEAYEYRYPWVEVDNRAGARLGVDHLLALGHSRIAFLGGDDVYNWQRDRVAGYGDALEAAGISADPTLVTASGFTQDDGYRLTRQLLERGQPPTAIFAISDVLACGAMRAARDFGLDVGRAFPIMGFDGLGLGTYVTPTLTTLRQPVAQVGRLLVQLLIETLNGAGEPQHVLIQPELVVRASTRGG